MSFRILYTLYHTSHIRFCTYCFTFIFTFRASVYRLRSDQFNESRLEFINSKYKLHCMIPVLARHLAIGEEDAEV